MHVSPVNPGLCRTFSGERCIIQPGSAVMKKFLTFAALTDVSFIVMDRHARRMLLSAVLSDPVKVFRFQ